MRVKSANKTNWSGPIFHPRRMKNSEMGMKLQQRSTHIPMGMKVQQRSTFRFFFTTSKNINIIRNEIPILELVQQMGAIMLSESYTTTVGMLMMIH